MELEIRLEYSDWCGVFGPRRMSAEDYDAAVGLCDRLDASPRWQALCAREGWDRVYLSGDDFRQWLGTETRRTREVLYDLGLLSASDTNCGVGCATRPRCRILPRCWFALRGEARGNPVRIRGCPAAVNGNDRRQSSTGETREATASRNVCDARESEDLPVT
nr:hypothetical protein GCM10020093_035100 [Planobispora longispora]